MALALWRVKLIKRSNGKSAVAAAAYRSAQSLYDERTGLTHNYTRKQDVLYTAVLAPAGAPEWAYDPYQVWNRSEGSERRDDAQTARDVRIALPRELTREQNIELSVDFAQTFVAQGMIAHVSVHDRGNGNPHSHIMLTMRPLDGDNFSRKKNRDWNKTERFLEWHKAYERLTNQYLEQYEQYGHKARIDIRSHAEQGIERIPTIHLGQSAHQLEQRGIQTERGDINRRIAEQNKEIAEINRQIDECQKEAEWLIRMIAEEESQRKEELEKQSVEAQKAPELEPASVRHDWFMEYYARAAQAVQETAEALQDRLTEKGMKGLADQEQKIENVRKMLRQRTQEPDTPVQDTQSKSEKQKQQDDFRRLYEVHREQPPDTTPLHTRVEESERKRQKQQDYDALYDAAKQKRKEHRIVRNPERQNRRYQDAYEQAEKRDKKISRTEQTTHHGRPEPSKPERQPDFQEQYRIAERRHHELERQKRRYSRSRDDPEHEK